MAVKLLIKVNCQKHALLNSAHFEIRMDWCEREVDNIAVDIFEYDVYDEANAIICKYYFYAIQKQSFEFMLRVHLNIEDKLWSVWKGGNKISMKLVSC